ncbi:MAG: hypothetical protein HGA22_02600 [Clostridiales bacterium]|nr:hypothetical protein [Clostridiales bacterium]
MKKFLIAIVVILVLAALLFYGVPKFILGGGKNVEVAVTEQDYISGMQKINVSIPDMDAVNLINLAEKNFTAKGTVAVDSYLTNSEMSAIVTKANEKNGPIKDFKINFTGTNQGDISFELTDKAIDYFRTSEILKGMKIPGVTLMAGTAGFISLNDFVANYISSLANNAAVFARGSLVKTGANSVSVSITELTVGSVSMSPDVISKVENGTAQFVNAIITSDNGFSIEELRVEEGKLYYKGTLPAEMEAEVK